MNIINTIRGLLHMSNTYPQQSGAFNSDGSYSFSYLTNASDPTTLVSKTISATQVNGQIISVADSVTVLDDGNYEFTTPEMSAEVPVTTFPTLAAAIAAIAPTVTAIDTASGVPIAVVNGAVDLTQSVTVPASDFNGSFTLVTAPVAA